MLSLCTGHANSSLKANALLAKAMTLLMGLVFGINLVTEEAVAGAAISKLVRW